MSHVMSGCDVMSGWIIVRLPGLRGACVALGKVFVLSDRQVHLKIASAFRVFGRRC